MTRSVPATILTAWRSAARGSLRLAGERDIDQAADRFRARRQIVLLAPPGVDPRQRRGIKSHFEAFAFEVAC